MLITTLCLLVAAAPTAETMTVTATMPLAPLAVGEQCTLELNVKLAEGWTMASFPSPILQIDAPASVQLAGKAAATKKELARTGFIMEPDEQWVEIGSNTVRFTLKAHDDSKDRAQEQFGLNVIAYVRHGDDEGSWFIRRRLQLPLAAGATATAADPAVSSWGGSRGGLQIGDRAEPLTLPRADGTTVLLADFRGKKNVLLTTYRAFW